MPVRLGADHAQLGEACLAHGRSHRVCRGCHLAVSPQSRDTLPVVHVVRLPELDTAVVPGGGKDGSSDVPANAPDTRSVLIKLASLPDVKPGMSVISEAKKYSTPPIFSRNYWTSYFFDA